MSSSSVTVDIPSGSPLPIEIGGTGTPVQSNTDLELAITQPIVTQSSSTASLDL